MEGDKKIYCSIKNGVNESKLKHFEIEDTFNKGNILNGFICYQEDYRYGCLYLYKINDEDCDQIIYTTPKIHYPFDKNGNFRWPPIDEVEAWEKIDGTNILQYRYLYNGKEFITFKTRLTPVLKDMKFGMFETMWNELLEEKLWIKELIEKNPSFNLSFELYGSRNLITILYETPLDTCLLFGINRLDHSIVSPTYINGKKITPKCSLIEKNTKDNLTEIYNTIRTEMTDLNKELDKLFIEGVVLYAKTNNITYQFKCKSEQIEEIHWAASKKISKNCIWTTCINTFEHIESPIISDVVNLLLEEFDQIKIDENYSNISKVFKEVCEYIKILRKVNEVWSKAKKDGFDITKDKNGTMRYISQFFRREDMKKVGTMILEQAGLIS